jgi:hypothetical protein
MVTSAIWNVTYRAWVTTFAPISISFSLKVVIDQCLTGDGAISHKSKELCCPENIRSVPLPPYSPELNSQEHVWDELREKEFPNRVLNELSAVERQLEKGLTRMSDDTSGLRRITVWPWITSLILNAF